MPPPRTFNRQKTRTHTLRSHLVFTRGRLRRHPLTQGHVAVFQDLIVEADSVEVKAKSLADEIDEAQVDIYVADDGLNDFAAKVWKVGEALSKAPDAAWRTVFFGGRPLSDFVRPIIGNQYEKMTQWPQALATSEHKAFADLAAEATPLLKAAEDAIARMDKAELANKLFREVGERAKLFDKANIARKTLYGELASLPHKNPGLAPSFPDKFFRRDVVADEDEEEAEPTIESTQQEIARLSQLLAEQQELLKALEAKAKLDEEASAERKADEAKLKQLEEEEAAKRQEKEALLKKLGKK